MEWITFGLIIRILFGLWCKHLACSKGYSELFGFIVGFFVGILGVIIYLLIPSSYPKNRNVKVIAIDMSQNNFENTSGMFTCPHCYNRVKVLKNYTTHKCPHCNEMFVI